MRHRPGTNLKWRPLVSRTITSASVRQTNSRGRRSKSGRGGSTEEEKLFWPGWWRWLKCSEEPVDEGAENRLEIGLLLLRCSRLLLFIRANLRAARTKIWTGFTSAGTKSTFARHSRRVFPIVSFLFSRRLWCCHFLGQKDSPALSWYITP